MSHTFGAQAVVVGAGIGGLAAAKVLSKYFERVIVIERDGLPSQPSPRIGTPQSKQVHVLLAGGLKAVERYMPGFGDALLAAGANRVRVGSEIRVELPGVDALPVRPFDFHSMCMSRPLIEFVLRRDIEKQGNIEIRPLCRATELVASSCGSRVTAVRYDRKNAMSELLEADFIVDASSQSALTLKMLDGMNLPRPLQTDIGIDLTYATAIFEIPQLQTPGWRAVVHRPDPDVGRGGFLFPIEGGRWHVNLNGVHGDGPTGDVENYMSFAKSLRTPTIHDALSAGTMVGRIDRFVLKSSSRRWFDKLSVFPRGLIPIGDAVCRFNPAYGQGMSVAAQEAHALDCAFSRQVDEADPMNNMAFGYFNELNEILETPWSVAEGDFVYQGTRGDRPADFFEKAKEREELPRMLIRDPEMHRLWAEVTNLLKPGRAMRKPPFPMASDVSDDIRTQ